MKKLCTNCPNITYRLNMLKVICSFTNIVLILQEATDQADIEDEAVVIEGVEVEAETVEMVQIQEVVLTTMEMNRWRMPMLDHLVDCTLIDKNYCEIIYFIGTKFCGFLERRFH